jgi:hypothetical protein
MPRFRCCAAALFLVGSSCCLAWGQGRRGGAANKPTLMPALPPTSLDTAQNPGTAAHVGASANDVSKHANHPHTRGRHLRSLLNEGVVALQVGCSSGALSSAAAAAAGCRGAPTGATDAKPSKQHAL